MYQKKHFNPQLSRFCRKIYNNPKCFGYLQVKEQALDAMHRSKERDNLISEKLSCVKDFASVG
jgi:hypothetical protein